MAKVHWLGATYTDVPAVSLPDGDGGESVFYEGGGGTLITKTITENGTYSAEDDDADGYSEVTVNVSGGGGEIEPGDVTFIDYDGTVVASFSANEVIEAFEENLSERITPVTYDYEPGWVAIGKWFNEDSTNNHTDVYAVQRGHTYICKLGSVVGNAFRSIILPVHPRDTTDTTEGILITEKTGQHPNDEVAFTADIDGYYLVTKDHASTPGLQTYFYEVLDTSLFPANPSHSGLTAQGWNYSIGQIYNEVKDVGKCIVGQMYVTDDGKTRLYCHFEEGRLSPWIQLYLNGTAVIDWGDGSGTDTLTGTSVSTIKSVQHSYTSAGDYMIAIAITGEARIWGSSSSNYGSCLIQAVSGTTGNTANRASDAYRNAVQKIEFGTGVDLYDYALKKMYSLASITLSKGITLPGRDAFYECNSLACVVVPNTVTAIGVELFYYCYSLKKVSIPASVTAINNSAFYYCYVISDIVTPSTVTSLGTSPFYSCRSVRNVVFPKGIASIPNNFTYGAYALSSITIPKGVTSIGSSAFGNCFSLAKLVVPDTVTSIAAQAFASCYGMAEYHFKSTTPPSLANTNAFSNIQSDCKIYVPYSADHSILNAYKTATNWSTYASYMVEEEVA